MEILKRKKNTEAHPYIPELKDLYARGRISRREFLRTATLLGMSLTSATAFVAACGPAEPTTAPAAEATQAPAAATAVPQPTAAPAGPKRGGTLTIATRVQRVDHPARLSWIEGVNQWRQVCEYLTYTGYDNITVPWLLDKWEANEDVTEWTLHLRKDVKFNDGSDFTADDVIFNLEQWLDESVGSSMLSYVGSYLTPSDIERVDDHTVKLHLSSPQIAVPQHLFHYPAMIVPKTFEGDITRQPVGTGPFLMEEYVETERAVLKRREDYYRMGADGQPLPYLDGLVYLDLGEDDAARIAALQSGQVDNIFNPSAEIWQATKDLPGIKVYSAPTAQTFAIRMRVDKEPWNDNRVRLALKKCIDRQKMLDLAWFGNGVLAHDAHVAPVHPEYCEKEIPAYDPEGAKALLEEAGVTIPLKVELATQEARAEPAMAQALKESATAGGFDITLNIMPSANYWEIWTEVPLGITIWAHRELGTQVMALAYTGDEEGKPAAWNETAWIDEEFSTILKDAERTLDVEKRRELMCQLEDIQMERGSVGIAFWTSVWYIAHEKVQNVEAHPTNYDILHDAWIDA
ncbi:MAG: ABC transporter substrate-binding protein [Candidatus Thermoplasmatota archaeon]|nr:ABC transporter substrate-binding protein [Candidatus Thermoplasmatota archaeon]